MNGASNALGLLSALMWFGSGLYVLRRARRCELSWRVLFAAVLVLVAALVLEVVRAGLVGWVGGGVLLSAALATVFFVATHIGRSAVGLDGWGITRPTRLDQQRDGEDTQCLSTLSE